MHLFPHLPSGNFLSTFPGFIYRAVCSTIWSKHFLLSPFQFSELWLSLTGWGLDRSFSCLTSEWLRWDVEAHAMCKNQAKRQVRRHASKPDRGPQFPGEWSRAGGLPSRKRDRTCSFIELRSGEELTRKLRILIIASKSGCLLKPSSVPDLYRQTLLAEVTPVPQVAASGPVGRSEWSNLLKWKMELVQRVQRKSLCDKDTMDYRMSPKL